MKELAEYRKYQVITIPDPNGVNCVYLNSTLFHCSLDELPNSAKVIFVRFENINIFYKIFYSVSIFLRSLVTK